MGTRKAVINREYENKDLRGTVFVDKDLSNSSFRGAILKGANFSRANLSFCDFSNADLYNANLSNTQLYSTIFRDTNLTRAIFTNASLYGSRFFNCDLTRVKFDYHVKEEIEGHKNRENYIRAAEIYTGLAAAFKQAGLIDKYSHYYYIREKNISRSEKNFVIRNLRIILLEKLIGYGEKPFRILFFYPIITFIYSLIILFQHENTNFFDHLRNIFATLIGSNHILSNASLLQVYNEYWIVFFLLLGKVLFSILVIGIARKIIRE